MTMTDRELLERAAKAHGSIRITTRWQDGLHAILQDDQRDGAIWNPLTDDGDALRLAVKLNLLWDRNVHYTKFLDLSDQSLLAATRCAIVRAAAAMAKED